MKKKLFTWEWIGFGTVCLLGTVLHFVFDWSGENRIVAAFSAVNESTWEHMKLFYVPFFLFTMLECLSLARELDNYFAVKAVSGVVGLAAIPILYYSLLGIFGELPGWVGVVVFFLSAALSYLLSCRLLRRGRLRGGISQLAGFFLLWLLLFLFVWYTYHPPALPLFLDPLSLQAGIPA